MKISVLTMDTAEISAEAWRLSRNLDRKTTISDVVHVDVPVNEMASVVLHFENLTIYEREIFASPRNHVMWARTSHVDDAAEFTWPSDFGADDDFCQEQKSVMQSLKAKGMSQDEYRFLMPIVAHTSWVQRMSFRDLVKMILYLRYVATRLNHPNQYQLLLRLVKVADRLCAILDEMLLGDILLSDKVLESYLPVKYLHEGPINMQQKPVESGHSIIFTMTQPLWMRAQIVRHRSLSVIDDLWDSVVVSEHYAHVILSDPIDMEISAGKDFWNSILGKRTCWLAQDTLEKRKDLWQEIIDAFGFRPDMLPCASGHCPYEGDAALRLTPDDPGAPCPRYMNIKGIPKTAEQEGHMKIAAQSRHPFWLEEIEK